MPEYLWKINSNHKDLESANRHWKSTEEHCNRFWVNSVRRQRQMRLHSPACGKRSKMLWQHMVNGWWPNFGVPMIGTFWAEWWGVCFETMFGQQTSNLNSGENFKKDWNRSQLGRDTAGRDHSRLLISYEVKWLNGLSKLLSTILYLHIGFIINQH